MDGAARALACAALAGLLWVGGAAADEPAPLHHLQIGDRAPAFEAPGADGRAHRLSDYAGKMVVLEWTSPACPYTAIRYQSGAMQALQRQAAAQGLAWISIDTAAQGRSGYLTPAAARRRIYRTHARVSAFLFDRTGAIGRLYGAKVTPTLYIVGRDGKLLYQGAMDAEPDADGKPGRSFARAALEDLKAGRAIREAETKVYGCAVEY